MIELEYLAHSSFLLKCGSTKIVFDPWLKGSAYCGQWYLWPPAATEAGKIEPDMILISHGHEDHLHQESLKSLGNNAVVYFPFQWRAGVKQFLRYLGFRNIIEAVSFHTYYFRDISITYAGYSLESVIVIEYKGEVFVNINDALNSNHETAVQFLLKEIKKRWNKIDYLLSGWSGAGHFPNQIRFPGKDDHEIALLREQYFANNFCRFTNYLSPSFAVPFVPGFALLKKENTWINHIKFPRKNVRRYYHTLYPEDSAVTFIVPFPGDRIANGELNAVSEFHHLPEPEHYSRMYDYYSGESDKVNTLTIISDDKIDFLVKQLSFWVNKNKTLYHENALCKTAFSIFLEDSREGDYLNIFMSDKNFDVKKAKHSLPEKKLLIKTTAALLLYSLSREWGGDALTIGYGLTVDVYDLDTLEKNLDIVCVRLITRYPIARKDFAKFPFRATKYYFSNPGISSLWVKQKIKLKPYVNKFPFNERDHWITYKKCELCAVCRMPVVEVENFR